MGSTATRRQRSRWARSGIRPTCSRGSSRGSAGKRPGRRRDGEAENSEGGEGQGTPQPSQAHEKGTDSGRNPKRGAVESVVTTEQLEAVLNVLNMLIDHADQVASKAQLGVVAARDLLVSKGIVTEREWDAAVDRVQRGRANAVRPRSGRSTCGGRDTAPLGPGRSKRRRSGRGRRSVIAILDARKSTGPSLGLAAHGMGEA